LLRFEAAALLQAGARRFRVQGTQFRKSRAEKAGRQFQFELNFARSGGDQERGRTGGRSVLGQYPMESIRPGNSEPIPVQASQHHVGTILVRFVGILVAIVVVMALLWSH
jgi:hypothetical protein